MKFIAGCLESEVPLMQLKAIHGNLCRVGNVSKTGGIMSSSKCEYAWAEERGMAFGVSISSC